jgi:uncharacterized membrane protein YqiK
LSYESLISTTAILAGGLGLGSGARARVKAAKLVATGEVWREEAEAQKARGDRLEAAVEALTSEVTSLRSEIRRLTGVLRIVAPELIKGGMNDDS